MARVIVIILDGVGVGALPDAAAYGDQGSNTLGNLARECGGLTLPQLESLGLGNLTDMCGVRKITRSPGCYGKCREKSAGKDSISGHWELMGVITESPFPVYPDGFPAELLSAFEALIGSPVLWGRPASGTEIIARLGGEHLATGAPIVYTSADSVFQIAAHEDIIPPEALYAICRQARQLLQGEHAVARVIARPFTGAPGNFKRTPRRHDFALSPPPHLLDSLCQAGIPVAGIGKIDDLYAHRSVPRAVPTVDNADGMAQTLAEMQTTRTGLIMTNLVQFDQDWGHRNDCERFRAGLESFDRWLASLRKSMTPDDTLVITADHGVDPTTPSTDHSREYIPLLAVGRKISPGTDIGIRASFCDVGATVAELLGVVPPENGCSIL